MAEKTITEKVKQSVKLREQAKELLEKAKRAVEIFIEQDEPAALKFSETNKIS